LRDNQIQPLSDRTQVDVRDIRKGIPKRAPQSLSAIRKVPTVAPADAAATLELLRNVVRAPRMSGVEYIDAWALGSWSVGHGEAVTRIR
jgi:hypothetical protein